MNRLSLHSDEVWLSEFLRSRAGIFLGFALFAVGVFWRYDYILRAHPPTAFLWSDMATHVGIAKRIASPGYRWTIHDTVYPPGNPLFLSALYRLDPTLRLAEEAEFVVCALCPLLIFGIAHLLFGVAVGVFSLMISSLYFPFVDYGGYFLAENPLTFVNLLAGYFVARSLCARSTRNAGAWALASGFTWALAGSLKPHALLMGYGMAILLLLYAGRKRVPRLRYIAVALFLGTFLASSPLIWRACRLSGQTWVLIGNNGAYNSIAGHLSGVREVHFLEKGGQTVFAPPAKGQRGYGGSATLAIPWWDSKGLMAFLWDYVRRHPLTSLLISIENVFDLFLSRHWPSDVTPNQPLASLFQEVFLVLILFPAIYFLIRRRRELSSGHVPTLILMLVPVTILALTAFLVVGEARYRIPFDGYLIILAAGGYLRPRLVDSRPVP
jgi:hypothetical protein